jgi:hypothetical protein
MKLMNRIDDIVGDGIFKRCCMLTSPAFYIGLIAAVLYIAIIVLLMLLKVIDIGDYHN